MSKEALAKVVQRAISDAAFRRQLNSDPSGALRGFDLSADEASALRTGDAGRVSSQSGSVAPVEGSPEATALENKAAGGGMANYPAHDGLAGPSDTSSVRAGDDWARSSVDIADAGRIGTARLDDATGGASGGAN